MNYLTLAHDAGSFAKEAGGLLAKYQKRAKTLRYKDFMDIVTTADLASEKLLVSLIYKKYPSHTIDSEEMGVKRTASPYTWVIDPLDGTKEYARGVTEYNCLVAVEEHTQVVAGAIWREGVGDLCVCAKGHGSTLNEKPIRVSNTTDLNKSFVGFHVATKALPPDTIDDSLRLLRVLIDECYRVRPGWDDARLLTWVAQGVLDAHIVLPLTNKWCDVAAATLLVQESKGRVTTMKGNIIKNENYRTEGLLTSNGKIHEELLHLIRT